MEARLSILFYGKKTITSSKNELVIYLRVTINGERFEVSTHRIIKAERWSAEKGKVKGNSEDARNINTYLDSLKQKVYEYQKDAVNNKIAFTKEALRAMWFGVEQKPMTLIQVLITIMSN